MFACTQGLTKKERKAKVVPLATVPGPWQPPRDAQEESPYDGPTRLVEVPALKVTRIGVCVVYISSAVDVRI